MAAENKSPFENVIKEVRTEVELGDNKRLEKSLDRLTDLLFDLESQY